MKKEYDYLVFIGRFQPFHAGHYYVVKQALEKANNIIIILGSHETSRSFRNPFTTQERIEIISSCFKSETLERIHFAPVHDHTYNEERWITGVQTAINSIIYKKFNPNPIKIGLVGYNKDHSSFYLKKFPQYDSVEADAYLMKDGSTLDAKRVRNIIFAEKPVFWGSYKFQDVADLMANETDCYERGLHAAYLLLDKIKATPELQYIVDEYEFIKKYKKQWEVAPYPPTFVTVDAVVTQSGHVLLVKRKDQPGKGLYALPGGYLNQTETLQEGMIRELYEETRIDVPKPVLVGSIASQHTYDDPNRSLRGRVITEAFHIKLKDLPTLPKVKGSDDAEKAFWMPLGEVKISRDKFFEDHYSILEHMIGI